MTEYRTEKYFKAKTKKDFIYFFPLRDMKKQSNAEISHSLFPLVSPDHGNILSWTNND